MIYNYEINNYPNYNQTTFYLFPNHQIQNANGAYLRMYISNVEINNFRGVKQLGVSLSKMTLIIGENDIGKTNFLSALALPLSNNSLDFNQKRLGVSDINSESIKTFYKSVIDDEDEKIQLGKIPKVSILIRFKDAQDYYEAEIVRKWLTEVDEEPCYEIRYDFKPKNDSEFLIVVKELLKDTELPADEQWYTLPIEHYEYQIISTNNEKQISFKDLRHIVINTIHAERDDFSDSSSMKSNSILTKLLINTLEDPEKSTINKAYTEFFNTIKNTESFKKILASDTDFENIKDYSDQIECIPNLPNLKNILSNITLGYGEDFLYQKGLGERNLIYIFLLFTYYKSNHKNFNLCCIEEPESHLCINNLRLAIDFINKSVKKSNSLFQVLLTSHSPSVINKLKLNNVVAFSGNNAISLNDVSQDLLNYLRKRPNFDILKLLFARKVILVEGPTEEMLLNTILQTQSDKLNNIEVISIGQKGYRTFLDVWLKINKDNPEKKIGVVRDYDNQEQAKKDHDVYDNENENITVRTTTEYTLEDDFVRAGDNCKVLSELFGVDNDYEVVSKKMKEQKAGWMLQVCDGILTGELDIQLPEHIFEVIEEIK